MSDGGAQVIGEVVKGVAQVARFRVGRMVLWYAAAWLCLSAITSRGERPYFLSFFGALCLALAALLGHFWAERKRRDERAALRTTLMMLGLVVVSLVGGLWLSFRTKRAATPSCPTEAEIDELLR